MLLGAGAAAQLPDTFRSHDFGDVPVWAWTLDKVPYDSNAAAVVLQDVGKVELDLGTDMFFHRHIRIKILHPDALDLANVKIPFYTRDNIEQLTHIKGASYTQLANGSIRVRKVKKKQTYRLQRDAFWEEQAFTLPLVQPGTVIEYRYTIKSQNIAFLETWDFQWEYPVLYSKISMRLEDDLMYRSLMQGQRLAAKYDGTARRYWELSRLPAIPDEPLSPNPQDYVERLRFQLQSYKSSSKTIPGGLEWSTLMRDWEQLAWQLRQGKPWQHYLNSNGPVRAILQQATPARINTDRELINALYVFLQQKVHWDQQYNIFPERTVKEVWESKKASSVEMNLLLYRMLQMTGVEVWPVLISTRDNGRMIEELPLLSAGNHVLLQMVVDGDTLLTDAIAYDQPLGILPLQSLNGKGYRISNDHPGWVTLENDRSVNNHPNTYRDGESWEIDLHFDTSSMQPEYVVQLRQRGYPAYEQRQLKALHGLTIRPWPVLASLHDKGITLVPPFDSKRLSTEEDALSFRFHIDQPRVEPTTLLMPGLSLLNPIDANPFTARKRSLPIDFGYAQHQQMKLTIHLPEGWRAEEAVFANSKELPLRYGWYRYQSKVEGCKVIITSELHLDKRIPSRYHEALRQFYSDFLQVQDRPVLLRAIPGK